MFDHVQIAVSDFSASERFYRTVLSVLGAEPVRVGAGLVEREDWDLAATDAEHPVSHGLHVGFRAPDRAAVDAFWRAGVEAGYRSDGEPGERPQYAPDYYGGFLLDPDGHSIEAICGEREHSVPPRLDRPPLAPGRRPGRGPALLRGDRAPRGPHPAATTNPAWCTSAARTSVSH